MNTEALIPALAAIEKADGPAWYDWCDLKNLKILDDNYDNVKDTLNEALRYAMEK